MKHFMDKERRAETIIEMTREAVETGNKNLLRETLGFVEGMRRSGEFKDDFASLLKRHIKEEWWEKRRDRRKRFKKMWRLTA